LIKVKHEMSSSSLLRVVMSYILLFCLLSSLAVASPLAQLDPKLRAVIESDPELMAEVESMIRTGTFPAMYDTGRLFNYQRLGK
ncbi:hypothetical protein PFISCL1PPCAC_4997, partial [Pristionchus fissidentatus]